MSHQVHELESLLRQQIAEHQKLAGILDAHHAAMRAFDLKAMDAASNQQEACRLRIAGLEVKRRALVTALARAAGALPAAPAAAAVAASRLTLGDVARLYPPRGPALQRLREELKGAIAHAAARGHVAGRVAGAVLGHLNTVVRLVAGAVERAGLYTKHGVPKVSARLGMMDAVG